MKRQQQPQRNDRFHSPVTTWILLGFLAIGTFFLLTEQTAHVLGLLPYALFLLCPLMMFFMMRGMHDGHSGHKNENGSDTPDQPLEREGNREHH